MQLKLVLMLQIGILKIFVDCVQCPARLGDFTSLKNEKVIFHTSLVDIGILVAERGLELLDTLCEHLNEIY